MTLKKQLSDWHLLLLQFPEMLRVLYSNFFSIILPLSILLERKKKKGWDNFSDSGSVGKQNRPKQNTEESFGLVTFSK